MNIEINEEKIISDIENAISRKIYLMSMRKEIDELIKETITKVIKTNLLDDIDEHIQKGVVMYLEKYEIKDIIEKMRPKKND